MGTIYIFTHNSYINNGGNMLFYRMNVVGILYLKLNQSSGVKCPKITGAVTENIILHDL